MSHPEKHVKERSVLQWVLRNPIEVLVAFLILLLTAMVFLQVLFRYALDAPLGWSEEFVMFLFQWCSYLGAAVAVKKGFHFQLDIIILRLPERLKKWMALLSSVCVFLAGYIMIHHGIRMMNMNFSQTYPILGFPVAYGYLAIPVAGAVVAFYQCQIFYRQIRDLGRR
jgi:TRAP-type C4-dicarboxylate transport system permease small subunit